MVKGERQKLKWNSILNNKKGATVDNLFIMVKFFVLVIFFLTLMLFWNGVKDSSMWTDSSTGPQIKNNAQNLIDNFDFMILMGYFGLHLGVLVMAFLLRTHPFVYVVSILLIALLAIVAVPLSNAYMDIQADSEISAVVGDIPKTNFIMNNLPRFEVIFGFITAIILFGLARHEGII